MFRSLGWKVVLSFVLVTILSTMLVNSVWKSWYIDDVEQLIQEYSVAQLSYAPHTTNLDHLYDYLSYMSSSEDSYRSFALYNNIFEKVWVSETINQLDSPYLNYLQVAADELTGTSEKYIVYGDVEHRQKSSVHIVYLLSQFDEEYYLIVELPIHKIIDSQLKYKLPVLYTFIIFLSIAGLLLGLYVWKDMYLPIDRITTVVKRVARGQFDHQIFINRTDELETLANGVNQMIQSSREKVTELSDEKSKLEGVLNNMLSGVILISQKGHVEYVNPSAERILGAKQDILISKNHQSLNEYGIGKNIDNALLQGEVFRDQITIHKGAIGRVVEISIVPIKNMNRLITSVIVVLHDISDIKRLERIRAEFVANVSHEIKTPITSIKGFAETIIDGAIDDREVMLEFTNIIYKESDRLSNLVQDLLDLSKIESSNTAIEMEDEDIIEIANEVIGNLKNQLDQNDVNISVYSNREHIFHLVNKDRIKQVFINLFSNAIAYSKDKSTVFLRVFDNERDVVIEVEDNGIGIPEKDVPRIFERFYRVHKDRSRATGGTGLGLSIVKHIIEIHQGSIEVESKVGIGTVFRITLPKEAD